MLNDAFSENSSCARRFNKSKMDAPGGNLALVPLPHVLAFITSKQSQEQMSAPQTPPETHELARLRALVIDYETKLTDAAALVAHVRHEINNPLAALLGQAQLMLREELGDKARRRVETIEKLAIRIKETVAELRDVQTPVAAVNRAEE
jgi:signal transduction histidine kinase